MRKKEYILTDKHKELSHSRESGLRTPCYVIDRDRIRHNLEILRGVSQRTGARILLAQKAFSCYGLYPLVAEYLAGATASGLYEARLWDKYGQGKENHIFSPAFREEEWEEILGLCDHIVFNSWRQVDKFASSAKAAGKNIGLRINPECSTQEGHAIYDPCGPGSRLGVTLAGFLKEREDRAEHWEERFKLLDGLHFHTLCEQDSDALEKTLDAVEERFGPWLSGMKWLNFGGGHHITREGYDIPRLERCIRRIRDKYGLQVYLEPGEAVALNGGELHTRVLETAENGMLLAILDASAACHMPDVLEMPYRPPLAGSGQPGDKAYTYRLGGPTCLAGDICGDYSFDTPLQEGDVLVFEDMAIYSMVKNNTFNGVALPSIYIREGGKICLWKSFGYHEFERRL